MLKSYTKICNLICFLFENMQKPTKYNHLNPIIVMVVVVVVVTSFSTVKEYKTEKKIMYGMNMV